MSVTDLETVPVAKDADKGMTSHIICPHCHPEWQGEIGIMALCGEKLLGVPADGKRVCSDCKGLWGKHIYEAHRNYWGRG
jgi:hypothetical protein